MNRQQIFAYAQEKYGTEPEYLWVRYPSYAVLRHGDNQKWYGMVMEVPQNKLGLPGTERVEILNVRGDPAENAMLRLSPGILPGYHMNKSSWLSILLDGTVGDALILDLLDRSFEITA